MLLSFALRYCINTNFTQTAGVVLVSFWVYYSCNNHWSAGFPED